MSASSNSRVLLYPRRLDSSQRQIRVLSFETDSDQGDIHLIMLEVPLDDGVVTYDALSYTWGNPTPETARSNPWSTERAPPFNYAPRPIYVNRQQLEVTANLFFALQRLRPLFQNRWPVRCLWVDAVCINQDDLFERTEQVKLMGDVYRNAEDVLVWLGEEEGETDSDMALNLLNNVYHSFIQWGDNDEEALSLVERMEKQADDMQCDVRLASTGVPYSESLTIFANLTQLLTLWIQRADFSSLDVRCDARAWASVGRLLERSWFTRLWTYQEKALARSATLLVGGKSISWAHAATAMGLISNHDNTEGREKLLLKGESRRFFESSQPSEADVLALGGAHQNLFEVVRSARSRECYDPRDKIYGVLGTMNKQDAGYMHIFRMLDYETTSAQDLYTEFARFYLKDTKDLRILLCCSCYPGPLDGLPSWAPDWSKPQFGCMLPDRAYRAAKQSEPEIEYRSNSQEMLLFGIVIDRVRLLVPLTQSTMPDIIAMEPSEQVEVAQNQIGQLLFLYMAHQNVAAQHLLRGRWIDLASSTKWEEPYLTGETYAEAYWRTLIGDMDPYAFAHVFKCRAPQDLSIADWVDRFLGEKPMPSDFEPQEPDMVRRRDKYFFPLKARVQALTMGKSFYLTEKGFMGLGTHNTQEGDVVVVFLGCDVPMLLQKHDDHYTVVGETYVHGFMDGRAIEMLDSGEDLTEFNLR